MRPFELLREALASASAHRVPTLMIAALAAAMCLTTLLTVGRTAHAQQEVQAALDAAGSRALQVTDTNATLLDAAVVDAITSLSSVERTVARSSPVDAVAASTGAGGAKITTWGTYGDLRGAVTLTAGRWPVAGEAIVSAAGARTLALDAPTGALTSPGGTEYPIVGIFTARAPFEDFSTGALHVLATANRLRTIDVVTMSAAESASTQAAVLSIIAAPDPSVLKVISPATLADIQQKVTGSISAFGAGLLLLVLGAGAVLTTLVVLADTLVRRADLGRRRALGASRTAIVVLVTARTVLPACAGAITATVLGGALTARDGAMPPLTFIGGTAVLAIITATVAALVPALLAAYRDPVTVLRTP